MNVDVHLYKNISALCYIAPAAIVKFRIGSPKMARNEKVTSLCASEVI